VNTFSGGNYNSNGILISNLACASSAGWRIQRHAGGRLSRLRQGFGGQGKKPPRLQFGGFTAIFPCLLTYNGKPLKCTGLERRILDLRILDF